MAAAAWVEAAPAWPSSTSSPHPRAPRGHTRRGPTAGGSALPSSHFSWWCLVDRWGSWEGVVVGPVVNFLSVVAGAALCVGSVFLLAVVSGTWGDDDNIEGYGP